LSLEWNSECVMEGESGEQVVQNNTNNLAKWHIYFYADNQVRNPTDYTVPSRVDNTRS